MIIVGIDPGMAKDAPGAIAAFSSGAIMGVFDIPTLQISKTAKTSLDYHTLARLIKDLSPGQAFVEQIWNRPGEGHSGALVGCYMAILATLTTAGVPWTPVTPQKWKRALSVPAEKDGARARASQLIPSAAHFWPLKKHHGRAEAALIALYGIRTLVIDQACAN